MAAELPPVSQILRIDRDIVVFDRKLEKGFISVGFELKQVDWTEVETLVAHGSILISDIEARNLIEKEGAIVTESVLAVRARELQEAHKAGIKRQWQYERWLAVKVGEQDLGDYSASDWVFKAEDGEERHVFENGIKLTLPVVGFIPKLVISVPQVSGNSFYFKIPSNTPDDKRIVLEKLTGLDEENSRIGRKVVSPSDIRGAFDSYGKVDEETLRWYAHDVFGN